MTSVLSFSDPDLQVIRVTETGEQVVMCSGNVAQCSEWLRQNRDGHPGSVFAVQALSYAVGGTPNE